MTRLALAWYTNVSLRVFNRRQRIPKPLPSLGLRATRDTVHRRTWQTGLRRIGATEMARRSTGRSRSNLAPSFLFGKKRWGEGARGYALRIQVGRKEEMGRGNASGGGDGRKSAGPPPFYSVFFDGAGAPASASPKATR